MWLLTLAAPGYAEGEGQAPPAESGTAGFSKPEGDTKKEEAYDFENEDAYMDVPDALRSKQFVHRAILSTIIRDTSKVNLGGFYFNYLLGFNAIYQPSNRASKNFAKYVAGAMGIAAGYTTKAGHSAELGFEASSVSSLFVGYRYFMTSESYTLWPYVGAGMGMEVDGIQLSDVPIDAKYYAGQTQFGFFCLGAVVPLVDLAVKVEARANFFGLDRLMLTTGLGVIFFI